MSVSCCVKNYKDDTYAFLVNSTKSPLWCRGCRFDTTWSLNAEVATGRASTSKLSPNHNGCGDPL